MEWFIKHGGVANIELYNCSAGGLTAEEYAARDGVRHPVAGILAMSYGILIQILYVPCMLVICSREYISYPCYKIMCMLGLLDMCAICVNSLSHGYFLYTGAVFCSHPNLIFFIGSMGLGLWCMACVVCLLLVINRLIDIWRPTLGVTLFDGCRVYFWLLIPFFYGLYFILFTPPVIFTSKYMSWFFDPSIYTDRTMEYQNPLHSFNNLALVGFTCCLYAFFYMALGKKIKTEMTTGSAGARAHKQIFVQSSMICLVNMGASIIYVAMNYLPVPFAIIVGGHCGWMVAHGCPTVIYLVMNRTIRNGVLRRMRLKGASTVVSSTGHQPASKNREGSVTK